jgi:hypothetical protein
MLREDGRFDPVRSDIALTDLTRLSLLKSGSDADVVLAEIAGERLPSLPIDDGGSLPLVLLIDDVNRKELVRALHAGARAVLPRDAQPFEIFVAIEEAAGLT